MSRFNVASLNRTVQVRTPTTTNYAGGSAWAQDPELELASLVTTSLVQDQYYRTAGDTLNRLIDLLSKVDPYYAAQAAVYARNEDGLRSITHVLAAELVHRVKGEEWTKNFLKAVIRRPDDATEIVAYYLQRYGKTLPNSLKKGVGLALGKFDEYQLAKYRGEGGGLKLIDVVRFVHPVPTERNRVALDKLVKGELRVTKTWEAKQSAAGQAATVGEKVQAKKEAWGDFLANPAVEYFALLRNLRNIANQDDPALVKKACARLTEEKRVRRSLVLPFQFVIALQELYMHPRIVQALSEAIDLSIANVPDLGHALVAVDGSGSMQDTVSGNEKLVRKDVGALFGAVLFKKNLSDVVVFGSTCGRVFLNPADSTLTNAARISQTCYGHSTNFHAIFEQAGNVKYDTVVIFSDMQAWVTAKGNGGYYVASDPRKSFDAYKARTGARPKVFAFDLAGLGTAQFPEPDVFQLAGFSDKTIGLMDKYRQDPRALVTAIKAVTF